MGGGVLVAFALVMAIVEGAVRNSRVWYRCLGPERLKHHVLLSLFSQEL